jgi:hypothetical protein
MGPAIMPAWLVRIGRPRDRLWVNDEIKQDSSTSQLIIGWRRLVSDISRRITSSRAMSSPPAPAGVGMPRHLPAPRRQGRVEITGLGVGQRHRRAHPAAHQ